MEGKRVLITGGGSGIGRACADAFAAAGAEVCIIGRSEDELQHAIGSLEGEHFYQVADVSDEKQMVEALDGIKGRWATIDVVVANAGVNGTWAPLADISVEEWDTTIGINLRGTFITVRASLPLLQVHGGSVIVISSINGTRVFSNSGATAYSCSKAGQVAFARMAALELAKDRIRVNTICPGAIETNIDSSTERRNLDDLHLPVEFPKGDVPLTGGRSGKADEVAAVALFLASDGSRHVTGAEIFVDGAQSLLQG